MRHNLGTRLHNHAQPSLVQSSCGNGEHPHGIAQFERRYRLLGPPESHQDTSRFASKTTYRLNAGLIHNHPMPPRIITTIHDGAVGQNRIYIAPKCHSPPPCRAPYQKYISGMCQIVVCIVSTDDAPGRIRPPSLIQCAHSQTCVKWSIQLWAIHVQKYPSAIRQTTSRCDGWRMPANPPLAGLLPRLVGFLAPSRMMGAQDL